jgi:hypothetical protein
VVAFFDAAADKYVTFTFDGTAWTPSGASTAGIAASGTVQAIHAGDAAFAFDGTTLSGIGGDLLYETDGTFTVDVPGSTAYVTLTMDRGFTTAIKMEGSTTLEDNENWRFGGQGLWVMGSTNTLAATAAVDPAAGLKGLFVLSNVSDGTMATPDAAFTNATQAVFHVWDQDLDNDATSFNVYDASNPGTVYTRGDLADLTVGASMIIAGPVGAGSAKWTSTTLSLGMINDATFNSLPISGSLTVVPTVTPGGTSLTYKWYSCTDTSYAGAALIAGADTDTYAIPTNPANGTYYYFAEVTANGGATVRSNVVTVTVNAPTTTLITAAAPTGIVSPVAGATPATTITPGSAEYTAALAWVGSPATFAANTAYTATATLTAASGYTFAGGFASGDDLSAFTVNGVTPTWVGNSGTDLVLSYAFPATEAVVPSGAVGGVTAPAVGATPATAVTPTSEYTGTIAWNPADATFAQGTAYTATVTLTAADGFTFATMDAAALAAAYPVAGANAPTYSVSADGKTLTITAPFTATPANGVTYGPNGTDDNWN